MKIIGITGGVGAGKSQVLTYLSHTFQAVVCQADTIAKQLQEPGAPCYRQIIDAFGRQILQPMVSDALPAINRAVLAELVFSDAGKLQRLNHIVHPAVKSRIQSLIEQERRRCCSLFVLEAALLIEADYGTICDEMWYIYASSSTRAKRLKEHRQYSEQKIKDMMASQLPDEMYRNSCTRIIHNNGSFETAKEEIREALYEIM